MYNKRFYICIGVLNIDFILFNLFWEFYILLVSIGFLYKILMFENIIFSF